VALEIEGSNPSVHPTAKDRKRLPGLGSCFGTGVRR